MNQQSLKSGIIGISIINILSGVLKDIYHSVLFRWGTYSEFTKENSKGIIIEYGDYYPEISIVQKYIKYLYIDKGWLRYYVNTYQDFKNSDIGYIELNIAKKNQMTFDNFIEKIAPNSSENWIKSKYFPCYHNCQHFVVEVIKVLNPPFKTKDVFPKVPKLSETKNKKVNLFL